jgi:hypothetical protein
MNLTFKLSNSSDYRLEDSTKFIKKLEHSIEILKSLYRISEVKHFYLIKFADFNRFIFIYIRMKSSLREQ